MKNTLELKKIALAASIALLTVPAFAQSTATTDPVGFSTLSIAAAVGANPSYTFGGIGMTRPVAYQGSAETATGGTTTLIDAQANWVDNQFNGPLSAITHYLEITSGPAAGTTYDIVATNDAANSLTLSQPLAGSVLAGVSFKVRQHWTIASVFGAANEAGLLAGTAATADQILIFNGTGYDSYFFRSAVSDWRLVGDNITPRGGVILYPDDGVTVKRNGATAVNVTLMGAVKVGQTSFPVFTGNTFIANPFATSMTLASCGVYTGNSATGLAGGTASSADKLLIWNGTGYDSYFWRSAANGWRKVGDNITDVGTTPIPLNSSVVIQRTGLPFDWVLPQHPASF